MNASPDGYTIGSMAPPVVPMSAILNQPDFDMTKAVPVAGWSIGTFGVWTHPDYDISTLGELFSRYQSGEFETIGLQDKGDPTHVSALLMKNSDKFNFPWKSSVGYGGSSNAVKTLVSKEVPAIIASDGGVRNFYRNDDITAVAMLHTKGSAVFPDIPTLKDQGYPGEMDYITRFSRGCILPPGTSKEKRDVMEQAIKKAINSEDVNQWEEQSGNPVSYVPHDQIGDSIEGSLNKIPQKIDVERLRQG
jgi:tripartite-type tricarboxylate transporter receptor subunit TctC